MKKGGSDRAWTCTSCNLGKHPNHLDNRAIASHLLSSSPLRALWSVLRDLDLFYCHLQFIHIIAFEWHGLSTTACITDSSLEWWHTEIERFTSEPTDNTVSKIFLFLPKHVLSKGESKNIWDIHCWTSETTLRKHGRILDEVQGSSDDYLTLMDDSF